MPSESRSLSLGGSLFLLVFLVIYLLIAYPFAYFRHDDWLILGNAMRHVQSDWTFLFKPTLFFLHEEVVWFFRPLFKLIPLIFYKLWGFNYYLWLSSLLLFTLGALGFCYLSLKRLTQSEYWSVFGVIIFLASIHWHFGSLTWVGEGMMNCPQLFFLSLSTYGFIRSLEKQTHFWRWQFVFWFGLLVGIGFKESSIFQTAFLTSLLFFDRKYKLKTWQEKMRIVLPLVMFTAIFLFVRLFVMPINPFYVPSWKLAKVSKVLGLLTAFYGMPLLVWLGCLGLDSRKKTGQYLSSFVKHWPLVGLFALGLLPFVGHKFFSPGWLLVPAYYFVFIMALVGARSGVQASTKQLQWSGVVIFVLGAIPVAYKVNSLRMWEWKQSQMFAQEIIANVDPEPIKKLVVYNCRHPKYPELNVDRVVGFEAGLYELWAIHHERPIPVKVRPCHKMKANASQSRRKLILHWKFPKLTWLNKEALLNPPPNRLASQ